MRTLCFTGMDRAEEAKLKLLFSDANEWLGGDWGLMPEAQAEVLIVDLESMYGHMTWLKVHNGGKYVIALTTRDESEAEHILRRPVTVEALVAALSEACGDSAPISPNVSSANFKALPTAGAKPPVQPAQQKTAAKKAPTAIQDAPQKPPVAAPAKTPPPAATPPVPAKPAVPVRPRDLVLWDYLRVGGLSAPSRLELAGSPPLVIDARTDTYIGAQSLKPYLPYFELGTVSADRWQALSGAELNACLSSAGNEALPLARLRWLHALIQGGGELSPGYEPTDKFRLLRWPKTEREYPRHFRIATVMMQSPGAPAEIAAQSDTLIGEVNDFINASLDSGFAEPVAETPPAPESGSKSGGLLGRFRGKRNA